jgi:hypothetical protein
MAKMGEEIAFELSKRSLRVTWTPLPRLLGIPLQRDCTKRLISGNARLELLDLPNVDRVLAVSLVQSSGITRASRIG